MAMHIKADFVQQKFTVEIDGKSYTAFRFEYPQDGSIVYQITENAGLFGRVVSPENQLFRCIADAIEFRKQETAI
jgi:hypothetical protein